MSVFGGEAGEVRRKEKRVGTKGRENDEKANDTLS